jgi:hypothetical protein
MKVAPIACSRLSTAVVALILFVISARAQAPEMENSVKPGDSEIHRLCVADQNDRHGIMSKGKAEWEQMAQRDLERRKRAKEIYLSGGLVSGRDFFDAALILQHSDSSDDYLLAHVLCTVAIVKGNAEARWLSAATLDRYLQTIQQKQIFGTQYQQADQKEYTSEPYNPKLLTDAIRKALDVPTLEQQKKDLETYNKTVPGSH